VVDEVLGRQGVAAAAVRHAGIHRCGCAERLLRQSWQREIRDLAGHPESAIVANEGRVEFLEDGDVAVDGPGGAAELLRQIGRRSPATVQCRGEAEDADDVRAARSHAERSLRTAAARSEKTDRHSAAAVRTLTALPICLT
jgi:hypothetical protein